VATALAVGARRGDLVCRFGGEEFLVLLPATSLAEAADVAERLRQAVRSTALRFGNDEVTVTISIGVADLGDAGPSTQDPRVRLEHLVAVADTRVYAAKGAGRDRVVAAAVPA
jgi:diguanylate cyclase (GGDEF)-like protein